MTDDSDEEWSFAVFDPTIEPRPRFDRDWATGAIQEIAGRGITVESGLTSAELSRIEEAVGADLPSELRMLWAAGFPVGRGWPQWRSDPIAQADHDRSWVREGITFDIERNSFWLGSWGPKPEGDGAVAFAMRILSDWPPLVCVYGHRFISTLPLTGGPVVSIWQTDWELYGNDLADYLHRECRISRPAWAATMALPFPPWDDILFSD
jgi:hypothetical protein